MTIVILILNLYAAYHSLPQFRLVEDGTALLLESLQCFELVAKLLTLHVRLLHMIVHVS